MTLPRHKPIRWIRVVIVGLLIVYVLLVPSGCAANWLVLGENHQTIDPDGARQQILRVNGRAIDCWTARSPGAARREPVAYVLLFTGKGDRVDRWITAVAIGWGDRPVEVWGMNYPGSGASDGPVQLKLVAPSALTVFDALQKVAGQRPIFIEGASFGTTPALFLAAHRPIAGIVLHNPPPLRQLLLGNYGWWNLWLVAGPIALQIPGDLDSVANAAKSSARCVFILSEADQIIPPGYHELVVQAYTGPKRVIRMPGANHDAPLSHDAAIELSHDRDWLWTAAGL
jgi:hypothetical protein